MSYVSLRAKLLRGLSDALPGLISAVAISSLLPLGIWETLDGVISPFLFQLRGSRPWDSRIVMVSIDDKTLQQVGQFPLPRHVYADAISQLTQAGARVVVLNLLLLDSSPDDAQLATTMRQNGRIVLPVALDPQNQILPTHPEIFAAAAAVGHTYHRIEPGRSTQRIDTSINSIPALGIATAQVYGLVAAPVSLPPAESSLWINWPSSATALPYYSFQSFTAGTLPAQDFKDKIVIIGATATGTGVLPIFNPFDPQPVSGDYLHAAIISNILQQNWLTSLSPQGLCLLLLIAGAGFSTLLKRRSVMTQGFFWIGFSSLWIGLAVGCLDGNYRLPVVPVLALASLTTASVIAADQLKATARLEARQAFISTMSHEIRTPMNAILGMTDLLMETPLSSQQQEFTQIINHSGQTLLALINDILDFAKIEAGQLVLQEQPVSLRDCIEWSLDLVAARAAEKHVDLAYLIHPGAPEWVRGDGLRLRQVLLNLLNNAVKFTDVGEVILEVQLESASSQVGQPSARSPREIRPTPPLPPDRQMSPIMIKVADTGIGIAADDLGQLFQPFRQVHQLTPSRHEGTGLGLVITQQLIQLMGGHLTVASTVGQGSTFSCHLPLAAIPMPLANGSPEALAGQRVLLASSHPLRCQALLMDCQRWQMDTTAVSSRVALQAALENPDWDVAIIDNILETAIPLSLADLPAGLHHLPVLWLAEVSQPLPQSALPANVLLLLKPVKLAAFRESLLKLLQTHTGLPLQLPSPQSALPNRSAARLDRKPLQILFAEDNRVNQKVIFHLLNRLGYSADLAHNGREALQAAQATAYDIILMDIQMPILNGLEATRQIRAYFPGHQQPWVIALTADALLEDRQRCLAAGMNDYLSKPIRIQDLEAALHRYFEAEALRSQETTPEFL